MTLRLKRVSELMKRELGDLIGRHFVFEQLVTVQQVDLTPDLKHAHVFVSVLGGTPGQAHQAIGQLQHRRKELQSLVSKRVILKYTPQLHFKLDESIERGTRIIDILQGLDIPEDEEPGEEDEEQYDGDEPRPQP